MALDPKRLCTSGNVPVAVMQQETLHYFSLIERVTATYQRLAVLNRLRLDNSLQILSLGRGPPLKIEMENDKIGLLVCLYP